MGKYKSFIALSMLCLITCTSVTTSCTGINNTSDVIQDMNVTWTIGEHATIKVEGNASLPSKVEKGKTVVFIVELEEGYQIKSVKANKKIVSSREGKYSIRINENTEIVIETIEKIAALEIKKQPTKKIYFSGETIDTAGMEVEVSYVTGRKEIINQDENGYMVAPNIFEGGETAYHVIFGDKSIEIQLEQRVEHLISINTLGGFINQKWIDSLKGKNLNNLLIEDNHIKFSFYDNLDEIVLPTSLEMTQKDHIFVGWKLNEEYIKTLTKENITSSILINADWQLELVEISSCELKLENVNDEKIPYLIIKGKFKVVDNVYLYLYEGNDKTDLKGDNVFGKINETFQIKYDLRKLKDAKLENDSTFEGKWMDIRLNSELNGEVESMELFLNALEIDKTQKISIDSTNYMFASHEERLKVYYTTSVVTYSIKHQKVTEGDEIGDFIVIEGKVKDSSLYKNKYVQISWWFSSEDPFDYGLINDDGIFKVMINMEDIPQDINGYAHFAIIEKIPENGEESNVLYGGTNTNLLVADSSVTFPSVDSSLTGGTIDHAILLTDGLGFSYYIGYKWDGIMLYKLQNNK